MIGTSIDRYKIVEELGHGGMSVVYRGLDTALRRDVAVKVLHNHLAKKAENRKRFHREAQAIARLRHPNILSIYDYSAEDAERSYIVMEYVEGWNLREFVAEHGPPPPEMVATIGTDLCRALSSAHDHGIIHRDLKPENIMVSTTGELKLMDFGIAHVIDAETMTATGSLLGSPAHMAPELIEGDKVDKRVDIFALGTVLFWLATAELPFDGNNAPQVLKRVLEGIYRDPEEVDPKIGHELGGIIKRCMAHDPDERFANVREVERALLAFAAEGGVEDHEAELTRYLRGPEEWTESHLAQITDRLTDRATQALRDKDVPAAMCLFNRVLSYEPNNEVVRRELEAIHRRTALSRFAGMGVVAAILVALGVTIALWPQADPVVEPEGDVTPDASVIAFASDAGTAIAANVAEHSQDQLAVATSIEAGEDTSRRIVDDARTVADAYRTQPLARVVKTPVRRRFITSKPTGKEDAGSETVTPPETFRYRFRLSPPAAELTVNGRTLSSFAAAQGIELASGDYTLSARSKGCKPWTGRLNVEGPQQGRMDVVLKWEDGVVKVFSDVDSVVYLGETSTDIARRISARKAAIFRFPFGNADERSARRVTFRIAPTRDLTKLQRHVVNVRPGFTENVNVAFAPLR